MKVSSCEITDAIKKFQKEVREDSKKKKEKFIKKSKEYLKTKKGISKEDKKELLAAATSIWDAMLQDIINKEEDAEDAV